MTLGKRGFIECKWSYNRVWEEDEYKSKVTREVGFSKRERFQKKGVTREVYGKDVVWVG